MRKVILESILTALVDTLDGNHAQRCLSVVL